MNSLIIFTILCASVGITLSAHSKGHHENHGTSMPTMMHQTEGPQMMGSDPTPEPEPEPAAKAKGLKEKSDMMKVTMSSNKDAEMMMASTESSNMMHQSNGGHEHGSTEASVGKNDMGKNQNDKHDHGKGKKQ